METLVTLLNKKNDILVKLTLPIRNFMGMNNMVSHEMIKSIAIMLVKSIIVLYKLVDVVYFQFLCG